MAIYFMVYGNVVYGLQLLSSLWEFCKCPRKRGLWSTTLEFIMGTLQISKKLWFLVCSFGNTLWEFFTCIWECYHGCGMHLFEH
jgi:hypothetical protein